MPLQVNGKHETFRKHNFTGPNLEERLHGGCAVG